MRAADVQPHALQRLLAQVLSAERQRVIAQLRLALPLHWKKAADGRRPTAGHAGGDAPRFVRICGAVLPVDADLGACDVSVAEVSAGTGLLLHFVTLASRYLGAPLLHQGCFRGSSSTIWLRRSFWDDGVEGVSSFPLYAATAASHEGTGGAAPAAPPRPDPAPHLVAAVGSWARGVGRLVLSGADTGAPHEDSLARDAWAAPGLGAASRQTGLRMLHRQVAQVCAHELGMAGAPPPPPWGPFALLAALCAGLARPQLHDARSAIAAVSLPTAPPALGLLEEEEEDSGEGGWTLVGGLLPPPPSTTEDELALWERTL